jgi:predicted secreted hydrolase
MALRNRLFFPSLLLLTACIAPALRADDLVHSTAPTTQATPERTPTGYLTAIQPRNWAFPRDHGRHDGFKTEWWYFSGNLADETGRKFGFQLTFFRVAITPVYMPANSVLSLGDFYFANAAVSDLDGKQFHFKDRMQPQQAKVAASATDTLDVALGDWSARLAPSGAITLDATDSAFAIHLNCDKGVGPVLQGPGGVNRKGREPGQASYYYSYVHLPTAGTLTVEGRTFRVTGRTWMDHEFSSNALSPQQVGWDWVGLTLNDGKSLMVYRLRNKSGGADFMSGTLIDAAGQPTYLTDQQIRFEGSAPWKSPSGGAYPQTWSLTVPGEPALTIQSRLPGQELRTGSTTHIDYFEGSCDVLGPAGTPLGDGYLEMTGYSHPLNPF